MLWIAAVLVVPVQINIRNAIIEIENKAKSEYPESAYAHGLSDAAQIVLKHCHDDYEIGKSYYIVMPKDDITNEIVKMRLYKITITTKIYYCFTTSKDYRRNTADLVLSNITSMQLRVFDNLEDAKKAINTMVWRSEIKNFR